MLNSETGILIVDDVEAMREVIMFSLEGLNCKLFQASSGIEGLEILSKNKVDLVISDLSMPKMNGLEFLERIRQMNFEYPPVFILSGHSEVTLEEVLAKGAERIVAKPFSPMLLLEETKALLEEKNSEAQTSKDAQTFEGDFVSLSAVDCHADYNHVVLGRKGVFIPIKDPFAFHRGIFVHCVLRFSESETKEVKFLGLVEWARKAIQDNLNLGIGVRFIETDSTTLEYLQRKAHLEQVVATIPLGKTVSV